MIDLLISGRHYVRYVKGYDPSSNTMLDEKIILGCAPQLFPPEDPPEEYYGITWSEDYIFILSRNYGRGEQIKVLDGYFKEIGTIDINEKIDGHQILFFDDVLYVTATSKDALVKIEFSGNGFEEYTLSYIYLKEKKADNHHINALSVSSKIDEMWVCESNIKSSKKSKLVKYDTLDFSIIEEKEIGRSVHNFMKEKYILSSHGEELITISATGNRHSPIGEWVRGIDQYGEYLAIGCSKVAERPERTELVMNGHVSFLKIDTQRIISKYHVERIGQVYDVRILNSDEPHNNLKPPV